MRIAIKLSLVAFLWSGCFLSPLSMAVRGENPNVSVRKIPEGREVRYVSGKSVYVEKLEGDRWCRRQSR